MNQVTEREPQEDSMPYQERNSLVSVVSSLVIYGVYCVYVYQKYQEGNIQPSELSMFWAKSILLMIPTLIVGRIVATVLFNIIYRIVTNEEEPSFSDELDKLIELKATRNSYYLFMIGFLVAMGALVMGKTSTVMFLTLFTSLIIAEVFGELSKFYLYRRGL